MSRIREGMGIAVAVALALAVRAGDAQATGTTSPGKSSVFVSATGVPLAGSFSSLLTGQILKGKKKTVLAVEASYTDGPYGPTPATARVLGLVVTVNGLPMHSGQGPIVDCGYASPPLAACTVTGTWWLDIDAAETANPGLFVNQPLNILLQGGDLTNGGLVGVQNMDATLSARVQKK